MRDDYLWDGSGEPDPEIQKLEAVLSRLRHDRPAPAFPAIPKSESPRRFWQVRRFQFAAVAAVVLGIGAGVLTWHRVGSAAGWDVTRVAGIPRVGMQNLSAQHDKGKLAVGQVLETDGQSQASIRAEEVGEIDVE